MPPETDTPTVVAPNPGNVHAIPKAAKRAAVLARRQRCWELRVAGMTQTAIAQTLGISQPAVHAHLEKCMSRAENFIDAERDKARKIDLARIESMVSRLWPKRGDPRTADSLGRLLERRAKLLGLDAAQRHEVSGVDGRPIETVNVVFDPTRLTTDQLRSLQEMLGAATVEVEVMNGGNARGALVEAPSLRVVGAQEVGAQEQA